MPLGSQEAITRMDNRLDSSVAAAAMNFTNGKKSGVPGWDAIKVIYCIYIYIYIGGTY